MTKRELFCLLLFLLIGRENLCAEEFAFQPGEDLQYTVHFSLGFISVKAAQANLTADTCRYNGQRAWDVQMAGKTIKAFKMFNVRDTIRTKANIETLMPYLSEQQTHENDYFASVQIHFDYEKEEGFEAHVRKVKKSGTHDSIVKADKDFYDVITTIYHLRNFDEKNLVLNQKEPMPIIFSDGLYDLYWKYTGQETVKTKKGETYDCLVIKPYLKEGTLFEKGNGMTIWITNDKNHIPVMIESKLRHGSIKVYLDSVKNNKYPLTSLVSPKK